MSKQQNHKIRRFPNRIQRILQDSGILLFTIIALYMIVCLVMYLTKEHLSVYEVTHGSISKDYTYTSVALRTEQTISAELSGYVTYYAREGQKAGAKTTICSLDESGQFEQLLEQSAADNALLTSEDILQFKETITSYQTSYNSVSFDDIYDFKQNLESSIVECVHLKLLDTAAQTMTDSAMLNIYKSASDGVLSYCVDGMENLTVEAITKDTLSKDAYEYTDLKEQTIINAGDPLYKLITQDDWSVVISTDPEIAKQLEEEEYVEVTFLKDNKKAWGQISTWSTGDDTFVQFSFTNSMIRYATERYLDIRFQLDDAEGLKLPLSSVATEDFYIIPIGYIGKGGASNEEGVILESYEADGSVQQKFVKTNIVARTDEYAYISKEAFAAGNVLINPDSKERFNIGKTDNLKGVYNINKGYTVFCPIDIICQNKEYCIVNASTYSGLSQYDRIVLDAEMAENNKAVY